MRRRIDVWWGGLKRNGGLMITLAYLLQTSLPWRGAEVRIKMVVPSETAAAGAGPNLEALVAKAGRLGVPGLSLSVATANRPAVALYRGAGFIPVGRPAGGSVTMLLDLASA